MRRYEVVYSDIPLVSSAHIFKFMAKRKAKFRNEQDAKRKYHFAPYTVRRTD